MRLGRVHFGIVLGVLFLSLFLGCFWALDQQSMFKAIAEMRPQRWFWVTIWDLYIGLFLAWIWVMHRESKWWVGLIWLVLFSTLGNMGVILYLARELFLGRLYGKNRL